MVVFPRLAGLLLWLGLGLSARAAEPTAAKPDEVLVPANFQQATDDRGMRWDLAQNGTINDGSNDCFDTAELLQINRSQIGFSRPMMTADGSEYVLTSRYRELTIVRRVRMDAKLAVMRYLETITNRGSVPMATSLTLVTTLGGSAQQVVDEEQVSMAAFGPKQSAFAAMQSDQRPGVIFLVAGARAEVRPTVVIQDNRRFEISYSLNIPAGGSVSVLHYLAQRAAVTKAEIAGLTKALIKRGHLSDRSLDKKMLTTLTNFRTGPAEAEPAASMLSPLDELAKDADTERGRSDTLFIDAKTKLAGTVAGNAFDLETSVGKTRVEFKDVAGVAGGDGVQRMLRIFLRSGDILTGTAKGAEYSMQAQNGLKLPLDFAAIHLLILHRDAADATAGSKPLWLIGTYRGERLVINAEGASPLEAATPWGAMVLPLREVTGLSYLREPFPAHRLATADGSRLLVMLRGDALTLPGTRFGSIKLLPQMVRTIEKVEPAAAAPKEGDEDEPGLDEPDEDNVLIPQSELAGDNRLAGTLDARELHLGTEAGVTAVATSAILSLTAGEEKEGEEPQWTVRLADDQKLSGRLIENVIPIRSAGRVWNVPATHLIAFRAPKPVPKATPTPSPAPSAPAASASPAAPAGASSPAASASASPSVAASIRKHPVVVLPAPAGSPSAAVSPTPAASARP